MYVCAYARLVLVNEKERNKRATVINKEKEVVKKVVTRYSRLIDLL